MSNLLLSKRLCLCEMSLEMHKHIHFSVPLQSWLSLFNFANLIGENDINLFHLLLFKTTIASENFLFKNSWSSSSVNILHMPFAGLSIRVLVILVSLYMKYLKLIPSYKWVLVCCLPYFDFQDYVHLYIVKFLFLLFSSLEMHPVPEAWKILNSIFF